MTLETYRKLISEKLDHLPEQLISILAYAGFVAQVNA